MNSRIARAAMIVGLLGGLGEMPSLPRATYNYSRAPGRPGIKKYRIKRRARNRMAAKSRARNRA